MFDLSFIQKQVLFLHEYGVEDYEITGGEPGEHKQLEEICKFIKQVNPSAKVAVITNGSIFIRDIFGIADEVLISYHLSKKSSNYDKCIFPNGCTWDKVSKTVTKARSNNMIVRTNTVLGTFNLSCIESIVDDIIELSPDIVNFLPVNLFEQSYDMYKHIDYNMLRTCLKLAIDKISIALPNVLVLVRYMPFCCMEGYEQHILGHVQHVFDQFDWMPEVSGIEHLDKLDNSFLKQLGRCGSTSVQAALQARRQLYTKNHNCMKCKYYMMCDGVEKTSSHCLEKFIHPSSGKLESDPMKYIGNTILEKYKKLYF